MSDHYLNDQGQITFIEGTEDGKSRRLFKPIGYFGPITVYEEVVQTVPSPPPPPPCPLGTW